MNRRFAKPKQNVHHGSFDLLHGGQIYNNFPPRKLFQDQHNLFLLEHWLKRRKQYC